MKPLSFPFPISAGAALALIVCCVPVAQCQTNGYWQYVKTEAYTNKSTNGAYLDKSTGIEGAYSLVTAANDASASAPILGGTFWWSRPPAVLTPGTVIDWPLAAEVGLYDAGEDHGDFQ